MSPNLLACLTLRAAYVESGFRFLEHVLFFHVDEILQRHPHKWLAVVCSSGPGSPLVSLHSSIWYYLALIELSSIPSLSPPSALLLSSSRLLPARDGSSERQSEPNPLLFPDTNSRSPLAGQLQHFPFRVFFSPITPGLSFLFAALRVSLLLFLSPSSISIYERVLMGL